MTPHDRARSRAIAAIVGCLPVIPDAELYEVLDMALQRAVAAELARARALLRGLDEGTPDRDPKPEG